MSQGRSYASTDGVNFSVIDTYDSNAAGNGGIRAVVTVGEHLDNFICQGNDCRPVGASSNGNLSSTFGAQLQAQP